jgi:hypothetical protein
MYSKICLSISNGLPHRLGTNSPQAALGSLSA